MTSWLPEALAAFQHLKESFTSAPILHHPDPDMPFIVKVDAIGALEPCCLNARAQPKRCSRAHTFPISYRRRSAITTWGPRAPTDCPRRKPMCPPARGPLGAAACQSQLRPPRHHGNHSLSPKPVLVAVPDRRCARIRPKLRGVQHIQSLSSAPCRLTTTTADTTTALVTHRA
ncbi:MAG: RNase H-like domain-containing protein [Plesiomonas shigelloides]